MLTTRIYPLNLMKKERNPMQFLDIIKRVPSVTIYNRADGTTLETDQPFPPRATISTRRTELGRLVRYGA
jgi:hypothetical protein